MNKLLKNKEGFTLIELLVVIAIIGVLAAVVLLAINPVQMLKKGRDSTRQSDLTTLRKAIDIYMGETGATVVPGVNPTSPAALTTWSSMPVGTTATTCSGASGSATDAAIAGWLVRGDVGAAGRVNLSSYVAKLPVDPTNTADDGTPVWNDAGFRYVYITNAAGTPASSTAGTYYSLSAKYETNASATNCFQTGTFVPGAAATYCW